MDIPEDGHLVGRTGDPDVDAELESLDALDRLPAEEHQTVYTSLHEALQRTLDEDPAAS